MKLRKKRLKKRPASMIERAAEKKLTRRCHWCARTYDARHESSIWCPKNPHRGRGEKRWRATPRITRIACVVL